MAIRDLIPFGKNNHRQTLARSDEDVFSQMRREIERVFDEFIPGSSNWLKTADPFSRWEAWPKTDKQAMEHHKKIQVTAG